MIEYSTQKMFLESYRSDLFHLNRDLVPFVKSEKNFSGSGLKFHLIHTLCDMRMKQVAASRAPTYNGAVESIRNYISAKIDRLNPELRLVSHDPWSAKFEKSKNQDLKEASEHFQDLVFAIELVSEISFDEAVAHLIEDINGFLVSLETYANLLGDDGSKFCDSLKADLKSIKETLSSEEKSYADVQKILFSAGARVDKVTKRVLANL